MKPEGAAMLRFIGQLLATGVSIPSSFDISYTAGSLNPVEAGKILTEAFNEHAKGLRYLTTLGPEFASSDHAYRGELCFVVSMRPLRRRLAAVPRHGTLYMLKFGFSSKLVACKPATRAEVKAFLLKQEIEARVSNCRRRSGVAVVAERDATIQWAEWLLEVCPNRELVEVLQAVPSDSTFEPTRTTTTIVTLKEDAGRSGYKLPGRNSKRYKKWRAKQEA